MDIKNELGLAVATSLIDKDINSIESFRPNFVYNDYRIGTKVLNTIINELNSCDEFIISVAFITNSGLTVLLNTFQRLESKGIRGKVLTSDYLNFNEASALRRLKKFSNIELKVCSGNNFHSKGYIFKKKDKYSFLVGSSNMTQSALTINNEWNLKLVSLSHGKLINDLLNEFNKIWNETPELTNEWLDKYEKSNLENYGKVLQSVFENISQNEKITPNKMQREALNSLNQLREDGKNKALLISATGTGKTYLAAFDVQQFKPHKMLFVIHREQIARDAENSFKRILGEDIKTAILSGNNRIIEGADYIFSTIQTLSRDNVLNSIARDYFDYICIDEVHRAGAESYQKIIDYFNPKFTLGMSATPERTDGFNIYEMFDYNIAYEIRLQKALEENMLCPFHYFGVTEISVNGVELDEETDFRYLTSEQRVQHIIEKINFYGYSGPRVRGLIFCSSKEECKELSSIFNKRGFQTTYLTGESSQEEREKAIERLEIPFRTAEALDYIFTVDIFNEGVDIPKVNQIVMLRPTQSAIIFVQQLGRGLRLNPEKEYVVVIDFIANYKKNFLIPIALSGDKTYNKDTLRRFVSNGTSIIPGASTIHFDEISKKKIYESIDRTNFSTLAFLKTEYVSLKNKINKIPTIVDIYNHGSIDPELIFKYSKSYYNFLLRVEKEGIFNLDNEKVKALEYITGEVANGKRLHEILILKLLLESNEISLEEIYQIIKENYNKYTKFEDISSAIRVLNSDFQVANNKLKFSILKTSENNVKFSNVFNKMIQDPEFIFYLEDLIEYSYLKYNNEYSNNEPKSNFVLYQKYSRKDVLRILNWDKDESSTVYGYRIKHNTCPIFVTYHKSDDISETTMYEDEFIDHLSFSWMTRNRLTLESSEVRQIIESKYTGLKLYLFIKKNDDEGTEFYYLGQVEPIDGKWTQTTIKDKHGRDLPIVNFHFKMFYPVRDDIYNYFTEESEENEEDN